MGPINVPVMLEGENLHDLQTHNLWLIQKEHGFRFGMDAVLLSDFCRTNKNARIADFGTGTGIISVLLVGKGKASSVDAFEILPDMADMAKRNVEMNAQTEKIRIWNMDCGAAVRVIEQNSLDAVVTNPPYGENGRTLINPDPVKAMARHQNTDTLCHFFKSAYTCLKGKGKLFLIYPVQGMLSIMDELKKYHLEPKRFRLIYPYTDKPANLVLIEAVKDAKPGLLSMPPLVIYRTQGVYTDEVNEIYSISTHTD